MPASSSDRTDRRRARTRAALLRAGQELFADRPVDAVSIDDIVAAADVAKGSFYNHFPDKDALARELADLARASVEAMVAHVTAGVDDPAERVARAICAFARQAADNPIGAGAMLRLFHGAGVPDHAMNRGVRADVQAGLAMGRFNGLSLEGAVLMTVGVAQIATARSLEHRSRSKAEALARDLAFGLLRGLGLEAAAARAVAGAAAGHIFAGPTLAG